MTIQSITGICPHPQAPTAYETCYCYDSPEHNLVAEPIVHDATEAIILALTHAGVCSASEPPTQVKLQFTDNVSDVNSFETDSTVLQLKFIKQEHGFTFYDVTLTLPTRAALNASMAGIVSSVFPSAPLCTRLFDYYHQAPKHLYIGITVLT